jgi:hypothetical protein
MNLRISYELSNAIQYRQSHRIFGDIDNTIHPLSAYEIMSYEFDNTFLPKIKDLFERDDIFFKTWDDRKNEFRFDNKTS